MRACLTSDFSCHRNHRYEHDMYALTDRERTGTNHGDCGSRRPPHFASLLLAAMTTGLVSGTASADNFANVFYSAAKDQLVITMLYRGTNPDHAFSLKWGYCQVLDNGARSVAAEVLDSQWQDAAQRDFKKTISFSLADIPCRPAKVTLRSAPRFFYTLQIPGTGTGKP